MNTFFTSIALLTFLNLISVDAWSGSSDLLTILNTNRDTSGWTLVNDSDGINVYTRTKYNDSDNHEVLATTEILAPPWRVNAVLADYMHHPKFMPYISETIVMREETNNVSVFQQLDFFPIPITDRYYTIRINTIIGQSEEGSYRIIWTLENDEAFIKKGRGIEVPVNSGYWELRPIKNGTRTSVDYYHMANSGGWLPAWMINQAIIRVLPKMIEAVKKRTPAPQYNKYAPY